MVKKALITGVTGQDGAYLAELLLSKGYEVHGVKRRASSYNTSRIDHIFQAGDSKKVFFKLHYGDLTDGINLNRLIADIRPHEIYNLAAQSHVRVSFELPEYTANADGLGTLRLLEAVRLAGLEETTRFYQASTSELYGEVQEIPQTEKTPFYPRSPYGVAKLYAYWIVVNYREAYGMHASNGILFNHESPLRGPTFVTHKITQAAARISLGLQTELKLGNLDSQRDWGHAREYVEGMWLMLQQLKGGDYVLATNRTTSVREFTRWAFKYAGIELEFEGKDENEVGRCRKTGKALISIDPIYFRPTEVDLLIGNPAKAKEKLGWTPKITAEELCREMVEADLHNARRELKARGGMESSAEALSHFQGGFLGWMKANNLLDATLS